MGIENAMDLVVEALKNMPPGGGDYQEFMDAIISSAEDKFGICSEESSSLRNAFNAICVDVPRCDAPKVKGTKSICEERLDPTLPNNPRSEINLYLDDPIPGTTYEWTFPIGWSVTGNNLGNQHSGNFLRVTEVPKYPYYPQHFTICVSSPQIGHLKKTCTRVTLTDCHNNDPTCAQYYGLARTQIPNDEFQEIKELSTTVIQDDSENTVMVFDVQGRMLFNGNPTDFNLEKYSKEHKIVFYSLFDNNGSVTFF